MIQQHLSPGMPVIRGERLDKIPIWDWYGEPEASKIPVMYQGRLVLSITPTPGCTYLVKCCGMEYFPVGFNTNLDIIKVERGE